MKDSILSNISKICWFKSAPYGLLKNRDQFLFTFAQHFEFHWCFSYRLNRQKFAKSRISQKGTFSISIELLSKFFPQNNDFDKWGTFKASYRVTWIRRKIYFLSKFLFKTLICGFTQTSKAKILEPTQISGTRIPSHERSLTLFTHSRISKVSRI